MLKIYRVVHFSVSLHKTEKKCRSFLTALPGLQTAHQSLQIYFRGFFMFILEDE
jgi:hypothetical protein